VTFCNTVIHLLLLNAVHAVAVLALVANHVIGCMPVSVLNFVLPFITLLSSL